MAVIDIRIQLAGLWVALMLVYLLGDVLRIFSGDFVPGEINGTQATQAMWMGAAVIMLIPILMILAALFLHPALNRWASIVAAVLLFLFNLVGLPTYPGHYDKFLIVVGLALNIATAWIAWQWTVPV